MFHGYLDGLIPGNTMFLYKQGGGHPRVFHHVMCSKCGPAPVREGPLRGRRNWTSKEREDNNPQMAGLGGVHNRHGLPGVGSSSGKKGSRSFQLRGTR